MKKIAVLVNGPGEISGWAKPVCEELKQRGYRIIIFILPCQFSNGRERDMVSDTGAEEVNGPRSTSGTLYSLIRTDIGLVLQLGGDLMFGRFLALCSKAPLLCYAYGYKKGMEKCTAVMTAYEAMAGGIRKRYVACEVVGDLVMDSLTMDQGSEERFRKEQREILFLPGSRSYRMAEARDFLAEVALKLKNRMPELKIRILLPFYADESDLAFWDIAGMIPFSGSRETCCSRPDIALVPPGTNNLEMMHCGIPTVIVLPFSFLDSLPIPGVWGYLAALPLVGGYLKKVLLGRADKRTEFLGWPNRIAGREIQRELRGNIGPEYVAEELMRLLSDRKGLERMREDLLGLSCTSLSTPAARLSDMVERLI